MQRIALLIILIGAFLVQPLIAKPYKGAELRTHDTFLYGRFEVRMKSAEVSGMLASFFTYHDTNQVPQQWNEIDIESLGRYDDQTQYNIITPWQADHVVHQPLEFNPHAAFHVMAIEWTPDYVAWHVDGYEIYRELGDHVQELIYGQKLMMNIWPPNYPGWVGEFDPDDLPTYAYYDWVKYYDYTPSENGQFTLAWSDDFDSWDQDRWGKGTHTWNGNNCDFVTQNAHFQDGYMILCLTTENATGYSGDPIEDLDVDPPYIVRAQAFSDHALVYFSESVDPATAEVVTNYNIPTATINSAELLADGRTVRLDVAGLNPDIAYNLIAFGVSDLADPQHTMSMDFTQMKPYLAYPIQLNVAGESWQDFKADQRYTADLTYGRVGGVVQQHPDNLDFANTDADAVYRRELWGAAIYQVHLPDGFYDLSLMFAETEFSEAGQRVFDVYAEGELIIDDLDVYAESGANTALVRQVESVAVFDGLLDLYFEASVGEAVLSGIQIEPGEPNAIEVPQTGQHEFNWQIYPNPFNPSTTISYQLPHAGQVDLAAYNVQGQRVAHLLKQDQTAGWHRFHFDASPLSSGVYLLALSLDGQQLAVRKAVYLK